jgi:hypothetical protein
MVCLSSAHLAVHLSNFLGIRVIYSKEKLVWNEVQIKDVLNILNKGRLIGGFILDDILLLVRSQTVE